METISREDAARKIAEYSYQSGEAEEDLYYVYKTLYTNNDLQDEYDDIYGEGEAIVVGDDSAASSMHSNAQILKAVETAKKECETVEEAMDLILQKLNIEKESK